MNNKKKYEIWKEDYQDICTWKYFDEHYTWCDSCKSYTEGICICYAR